MSFHPKIPLFSNTLHRAWGSVLFFLLPGILMAWVNAGFETGDTTGWIPATNFGTTWVSQPSITVVQSGPAPDTNGTTFVSNPVTLCPSPSICLNQVYSGTYAAQLYSGYGDANHDDWASLSQSDTVPVSQTVLTVWFAAVLEGFHYLSENMTADEDAQVQFTIQVGTVTVYSEMYSWYVDYPPPDVTAPLVPPLAPPIYPVTLLWDGSVNAYNENNYAPVTWAHIPWTQYAYDFSNYVGQQITINYTAYDCYGSGHYCYGYLDAVTWNSPATVPNSTPVPCYASSGFTCTPTVTPTVTYTPTPCGWPGDTCTPTATPTITQTYTPTQTFTPTNSPTITNSPTWTLSPTPTCFIALWPDPYNPYYAYNGTLKVSCIPPGGMVSIYTVSGELVRQVPETGGLAQWDSRNRFGVPASSGIYFYTVQSGNQVLQIGKFLLTTHH